MFSGHRLQIKTLLDEGLSHDSSSPCLREPLTPLEGVLMLQEYIYAGNELPFVGFVEHHLEPLTCVVYSEHLSLPTIHKTITILIVDESYHPNSDLIGWIVGVKHNPLKINIIVHKNIFHTHVIVGLQWKSRNILIWIVEIYSPLRQHLHQVVLTVLFATLYKVFLLGEDFVNFLIWIGLIVLLEFCMMYSSILKPFLGEFKLSSSLDRLWWYLLFSLTTFRVVVRHLI